MLYKETLEPGTLDLIIRLIRDEMFASFDLAGDTALSLQIGHRISGDIDLFSTSSFDVAQLSDHLAIKYKAQNSKALANGLSCLVAAVKVGIQSYPAPLVQAPVIIEEIRMASLEDISAIKLKAIVEGSNQFIDFADLYSLLEHYSLEELIEAYEKKYPDARRSMVPKALMNHGEPVAAASVRFTGQETTLKDLAYRFKKATQEPKRIFETVPWQRQTVKKAKGDKASPDKSRGKGWRL
ncbi:MAG TPA: nucleotidyl transferase AbiEii/AbiGii toxin family protein [Puia sp.]|nr:nucleotidyl transferase AbiEii/AbiGii toxin family protein [Puia sp.]